MCVYVYGNCTGVASIHVCALKYACACICVWACDCVSSAHVRMYMLLGTGAYRSVRTVCASMRVYVFVCVCTHILMYYMYVPVYMWKCGVYIHPTYIRM